MNLDISPEMVCVHKQVEFKPSSWWESKIASVLQDNFVSFIPAPF